MLTPDDAKKRERKRARIAQIETQEVSIENYLRELRDEKCNLIIDLDCLEDEEAKVACRNG